MSKFLITMAEYNRIHQVVHGVIAGEFQAETSCLYFATLGAHLLHRHYCVNARPVIGEFALCIADDDPPKVAFYGELDPAGRDAFHAWVQTDTHYIDFMAPIYAEAFAHVEPGIAIPRKMFQKPRSQDLQDLRDLKAPGDYMVFPDPGKTKTMIEDFLTHPINLDYIAIADAWFGRRHGKQKPSAMMGCSNGPNRPLTLPKTLATSAW